MDENKDKSKSIKLIFNIGEESLPNIIKAEDYRESPFVDAIDKGLNIMNDLFYLPKYNVEKAHSGTMQIASQQHIYPNNIVSFLGERGSGKTSCLLSTLEVFKSQIVNGEALINKLCILDIIDPSFFDNDHNILEIFIGEFYKHFVKLIDKFENYTNNERDELKKLQTEFRNVKHSIEFIDSKYSNSPIDELDDVRRLSSGIELSHSLSKLISSYLKFVNKECLIIVIDDLDLNINASYRMMEQIRTNLVLPNVIILMAAKLEQLKLGIESSLNEFKEMGLIEGQDISEMATHYLDKFLPTGHRIHMPDIDQYMKMDLIIRENGEDVGEVIQTQFAVLSLIFQKTRFLFYNQEDQASFIIPRNLRELRMLTTALYQMEDPGENKSIHEYNKTFFKKYFRDQWIPTLPPQYEDFAVALVSETALEKINKRVIEFLLSNSQSLMAWQNIRDELSGIDDDTKLRRLRFNEITARANYNANVSIGDVMYIVSLVKELEDTAEIDRLVFFINTFYSIRLYELYDEMTDNLDDKGIKEIEDSPTTIPVLRKDKALSIPDYLKFVAGSFFTIMGDTFIPTDRFGMSREITMIDGDVLRKEILEIIKLLKTSDGWNEPTVDQSRHIQLLEFFIFCSRRRILLKTPDYFWKNPDAWRTNLELSYLYSFNNTKNILFDVTAPFFTMVYPKIAYDRYDSRFYDLALNCKESILYKILNGEDRRYSDRNKYADLMSRICIRNMEVREDLERWLIRKKSDLRPNQQGSVGILIDFYSQFSKAQDSYTVKTYDKESNKTGFHKIEFKPLGYLAEILSYTAENEKLFNLFMKIYSPSDKLLSKQPYTLNEILQKISLIDAETREDKAEIERLMYNITEIYRNSESLEIYSDAVVQQLFKYPLITNKLITALFEKNLKSYYINDYCSNLTTTLNTFKLEIKNLASEITNLKREKNSIDRKRQVCAKNFQKADDELNNLKARKFDLSMQRRDLSKAKNDIDLILKELIRKHDEVIKRRYSSDDGVNKKSTAKLTYEISDLNKSIENKSSELREIETKILKISMEISNIDTEISEKGNNRGLIKQELNNLTKEIDERVVEINELESKKTKLTSDQKAMQGKIDSINAILVSYK